MFQFPFASDTSPFDAVTFRFPGNQGNLWHFLVGLPLFLAVPMIWLRLRVVQSTPGPSPTVRRWIWCVTGLCVIGNMLVEMPFLRELAGTSAWQRLGVLSLGFGIALACSAPLLLGYRRLSPTGVCLVALNTAYLANAALCLIIYLRGIGQLGSNPGWPVTLGVVCCIVPEPVWNLAAARRSRGSQ